MFVFFKNGIHLSCLLRPVSVWDLRVADIALHHCHSPGATVTQRNFICDWFWGKVTIAPGTRYLPLPWPFQKGNKKTENFLCCLYVSANTIHLRMRGTNSKRAKVAAVRLVDHELLRLVYARQAPLLIFLCRNFTPFSAATGNRYYVQPFVMYYGHT